MTDAPTLTLAAFVLDRIAEDEAVAGQASGTISGPAQLGRDLWSFGDQRLEVTKRRVLAQCAAHRRIVELHEDGGDSASAVPPFCATCSDDEDLVYLPCPTLRALASVWADHPAYRQEWAT